MLSATEESECSYRLAVNNRHTIDINGACEKNSDNEEHVYENIIRLRKKNYSRLQTLNNLIVKLRSKTKHLPKILQMNNNQNQLQPVKEKERLDNFGELFDEYFQEFDDGSYTSCFEENIYEDLDFYSCTSTYDEPLSSWFQLISTSYEDYDDDDDCDLMIHKSIPFRRQKLSQHHHTSIPIDSHLDGSSLSLFELRKLEIIKKCLVSIWYQETESGILKNLFLILKEIFTDYLRRETPKTRIITTADSDEGMTMTSSGDNNSMTKCEYRKTNGNETNTRAFDKTNLEHVILSMTLNKRLITYDKNLKIIFSLKSSPWCFSRGKECIPNVIKAIDWKNCNRENSNEKSKYYDTNDVSNGILEEIKPGIESSFQTIKARDGHNDSQKQTSENNIYENIWQCTNNISQQVNYEKPDCESEFNNNDWEIDSEFSFKEILDYSRLKMPQSDVIIYYKDVPKNDKICVVSTFLPVENWKNIIKTAYYPDDEEDMVQYFLIFF